MLLESHVSSLDVLMIVVFSTVRQVPPESTHTFNVYFGRSAMPNLSEIYDTDSNFEGAEDEGTPRFHLLWRHVHEFNLIGYLIF